MLSTTTLIGNLAADPEFKDVGNQRLCKLRVITDEVWTDRTTGERKKRPTTHFVDVWQKGIVAGIEGQLCKGDAVVIIGIISARSYEGENGKEWAHSINVNSFGHTVARVLYEGSEA